MAFPGRALGLRSRSRSFERLLVVAGLFLLLPIFTFITLELAGELKASPLPHLHEFYHGFTEGATVDHSHRAEKKLGTEVAKPDLSDQSSDASKMAVESLDLGSQNVGFIGKSRVQRVDAAREKPAISARADLLQGPSCTFALGVDRTENITTQKLYDEIEFKNEEGGVWRQGWPITYEGSEWDERKLRVFVVPHSHNDPGWIMTVEEYYRERTYHILNVIVQALKADSRRKFIWEEMSYLSLWWSDERVTQGQRDDMKWLIETGQLEIVGGGWVMNDEANAHHFAIVDQVRFLALLFSAFPPLTYYVEVA
jgi:hypothetical protein